MKRIMVGFFNVAGQPDSVETPVVGNPKREYAALRALIEKKHPKVPSGKIKRTGSTVELRDSARTAPIVVGHGKTVGQVFESGNSLHVGSAFYDSSPVEIFLNLQPAEGRVSIHLAPRLKSEGLTVSLGNHISSNRVAAELPEFVRSSLGDNARAVELRFVNA